MPRALSRPWRHRGARATAILASLTASVAALPTAAAPAQAARPPGGLKGRTAQGLPVALSAPRSFGRAFRYQATMTCSDGSTFTDDPFTDDVKVSRDGSFRLCPPGRGHPPLPSDAT